MARSRESVRENKAMQSILRGETPEKRIIVSKVDKDFQKKMKLERELEQLSGGELQRVAIMKN